MPSFSACSSRNDPVPAAQASFIAKSTTTPFSIEMNLESWPADFEDRVHQFAAKRVRDVDGAGLVGGDLVVDRVGADELRDQFAARSGGADAADLQAVAPLLFELREARLHRFDRPSRGSEVDSMNHLVLFVDGHQVRRHRADVDAQKAGIGPRRPAPGRASPSPAIARRCSIDSGVLSNLLLPHRLVLAQLVYVPEGALLGFLGLEHRRADRAAPGVDLGDDQLFLAQLERLPERLVTPAFCDTAPISATGPGHRPPLDDAALEIARHRVAQARAGSRQA